MSGNDSAEKERLEQERREKADAERVQRYREGERRNKDDPDETVIVVKKPDE